MMPIIIGSQDPVSKAPKDMPPPLKPFPSPQQRRILEMRIAQRSRLRVESGVGDRACSQ
jgi:hypothetical protein